MIDEALQLVGLRSNETLGRFPHQLSGGQRQRLMVARAMLCRPKLIMADEPVSMVDASLRATILSSLRKLNQDFGISIVYITHDLTTAYQISENIIIMYSGVIVEAGSVQKVIRTPKHPYTQLLISSIPQPSKHKAWGGGETEEAQTSTRKSAGCPFAPRCPKAMDRCWSHKPPLYMVDENKQNLRKLRGIFIDYGENEEFSHIRTTTNLFSKALAEQNIPHAFEVYPVGDHGSKIRERLETRVLQFFSEKLDFSNSK